MWERRGHGLGRTTRMPFTAVIVAITVVFVAAPVLAVLPASAASAVSASNMVVTMFSAPGDFIGQGISREFDATNASIIGTAASTGISLSVNGGTVDSSWSFLVDPPPGKSFREGYYSGVQRAEFRAAGTRASISPAAGGDATRIPAHLRYVIWPCPARRSPGSTCCTPSTATGDPGHCSARSGSANRSRAVFWCPRTRLRGRQRSGRDHDRPAVHQKPWQQAGLRRWGAADGYAVIISA